MKLPKELQKKKKGNKKKIPTSERIEFSKMISKINRKCRFKGCLYPDKSSCTVPSSIRAHSIQKNKILRAISSSGEVMHFDVHNTLFDNTLGPVGINEASTFFGFCNYHDTTIFSEIENKEYIESKKQIFLFAYRACAFEYAMLIYVYCHSKEMMKEETDYTKKMFWFSKNIKDKTDLYDMKKKLDRFSGEFNKSEDERNYDVLYSKTLQLNGRSLFAVNSAFSLYYDFDRNEIYDPYDYSIELPTIFLNVFPQNDKTFIIISCFLEHFNKFKNIFDNLDKFDNSQLEAIISQIIVVHCENLFISPDIWLRISKKKRESFILRFKETTIAPAEESYLSNSPPLNLFRELRE